MNWETINNLRKRHILQGERTFKRMYAKIRKKMIAELRSAQTVVDVERAMDSVLIEDEVSEAFSQVYANTGVAFARTTYTTLKGRNPKMEQKEVEAELLTFWLQHMQRYIEDRVGAKIAYSTRSMYADIEKNTIKAIKLGSENGWGADRIANEIMKSQGKMDLWKARRIARTEVVSASNEGAFRGAKDSGIELEKIWLATPHGDAREDHLAMNGQKAQGDYFMLPSGIQMEYPGDPSAPPEEVINCRCAIGFEPKDDIIDQILN